MFQQIKEVQTKNQGFKLESKWFKGDVCENLFSYRSRTLCLRDLLTVILWNSSKIDLTESLTGYGSISHAYLWINWLNSNVLLRLGCKTFRNASFLCKLWETSDLLVHCSYWENCLKPSRSKKKYLSKGMYSMHFMFTPPPFTSESAVESPISECWPFSFSVLKRSRISFLFFLRIANCNQED